MYHSNTERFLRYWRSVKKDAAAPSRDGFDPFALSDLAPQFMVLGVEGSSLPIRLSGGLINDLHGHDLSGIDLISLFAFAQHGGVRQATRAALSGPTPMVLSVEGETYHKFMVRLQITLAPLLNREGTTDRLIGLYQPVTALARLNEQPIIQLTLRSISSDQDNSPQIRPGLSLATYNGRRIA